MSTLVSIFSPRERIKMPPDSTTSPDSPSKKSALKWPNGDTAFSRRPSKKKIKWSADKKPSQDDGDANKPKTVKEALASASAPLLSGKLRDETCAMKNSSPEPEDSGDNDIDSSPSSPRISSALSEDECSPSTPNISLSDRSQLNQSICVVQEIVATERQYVRDLQDIIEGYLVHMRKNDAPVTKEKVSDLFMNIEEIYTFNKEFLENLEDADDDPVEIAYCFVNKEAGFETYTEYCTKYPKSMEVLTDCTQQKETAEFLQKLQTDLGHPLPLGSYLLKPVQRILKYHLLLQVIKKHFNEQEDPDGYDAVCDALDAMTAIAQYINEMKRQHEAALHVQEIQSQLSDFEGPDLTTYGNLILEDSFRMMGTRTERYLFLFERILLITKKRENGYTCKATLLLSNMMMTEAVPKEPLAFTIIRFDNQKIDYSFLARNVEQKNKWTLELKRLLLESLAATVPIKAKNLILGETKTDEENTDGDVRKKSFLDARNPNNPRRHSFRGSIGSQAKKGDKNNNIKEEGANTPDNEKSATDTPSDDKPHQDLVPTSPPPAKPLSDRVEKWERISNHGLDQERSSMRLSSELEDDAFLPSLSDRRQSAEDILARTKERRKSDNLTTDPRQVTSDSDYPDGDHAQSIPWVPKRSSSLKLLEAKLSLEKCMSDTDLLSGVEAHALNPGIVASDSNQNMTKHLDNFSDNSKIQRTVREVAKAFQVPPVAEMASRPWEPAPDEIPLNSEEDLDNLVKSLKTSKGKSSAVALEDMLASIDRDLDETRRTITDAQILECALRLRKDSQISISKYPEKTTRCDSDDSKSRDIHQPKNMNTADLLLAGLPRARQITTVDSSLTSSEPEERDLKAELAAWTRQTSQLPLPAEGIRTCSLDRRRGKKVFEMSSSHKIGRYSAGDFPVQEVDDNKPSNVYRMARQYSKRITDDKVKQDIRSRSRGENTPPKSPTRLDLSPRIKIERITKVTFDELPDERRVIRRRRRPGHSARDQKRASWSFEKAKPDIDGLHRTMRRERPRSLHEIKPAPELIEFEGDENELFPDGLEPGLAPAMLAGMEKDDIVVKGLVKHLVNKFNPEELKTSKPNTGAELL